MREILNMNKNWKFKTGEISVPPTKSHFATYMYSKSQNGLGAAAKSFYDGDFEEVSLPHDYVISSEVDEKNNESIGSLERDNAWYRKNFTLSKEDEEKRIVLLFDGAGEQAEVWINGHYAFCNTSMYNSFYVDATPYVTYENFTNTVVVKITNKDVEGWWYEGAGIYRNVYLIKTDDVSVDVWGTFVNPQKGDNDEWNVDIETTIFSLKCYENVKIVNEILDAEGNLLATNSKNLSVNFGENKVSQEIHLKNPKLWDLDSCYIHKMLTKIYKNDTIVDSYETNFGFRTIEFVAQKGFYLNGNKVKLRGACVHQDHGNLGVAVPKSVMEYRIRKMKSVGMNAYRCAHNNPSPDLLEICDRLGVLVLDENRWFLHNENTKYQITSMLKRDRNHPSVILWSVGNEEPLQTTQVGRKIFSYLKGLVNEFDTSRPVSIAVNGFAFGSDVVNDSDVGSINYLITKYDEIMSGFSDKPIVSTESGASNNNRGVYFLDENKDYKSQYATAYDEKRVDFGSSYADAIKASETHEFICGTFLWAGFEYRGEAEYPKLLCGSGIFDNCAIEKDNSYLVRSFWSDEPTLHIVPHWTHLGKEGVEIPVFVYTNADEVELFLNGNSLGRASVEPFSPPLFKVPYEKGSIKAVAYLKGQIFAEKEIFTAGCPEKLQILLQNKVTNNGEDALIAECTLLDSKLREIPTSSERVFVESDENCEILAVSNGDPLDHENAKRFDKKFFSGKIQVIARVKEGVGKCKIIVRIPELELSEELVVYPEKCEKIPRVEKCESPLILTAFRRFSDTNDEDVLTKNYNFDDMNTSQPVALAECKTVSNSKKYSVIIGKTVAPNFPVDKELSIVFNKIKGNLHFRIYHDRHCWPNPTPNKFMDIISHSSNDSEKFFVKLDGFSANEKINIVICAENNSEFELNSAEFFVE